MDNQRPQSQAPSLGQAPGGNQPTSNTASPGQSQHKIQHTKPGIIMPASPSQPDVNKPTLRTPDENRPLPVAQATGPAGLAKISSFGREKRHEDSWKRTPNTTGNGAIHVKTFHCKLTEDAIQYMDQAINEWLDAHPQYEVKFVSSTIGTMTGKLKEPALFCQVWV